MSKLIEENIEIVNEHLRIYWLNDGQIVVFELHDDDREAVDAWVTAVTNIIAEWPADKPNATIHDMRNMTLTPYARARAGELGESMRDIEGYSAVVVTDNVYGMFIKTFANLLAWQAQPNVKRKVFTTLDDAYDYITENLQEEERP